MNRMRVRLKRGWFGVLAVWLLFLSATTSRAESAPLPPPTNCRFGVAVAASALAKQAPWVTPVNAEWYLDFSAHAPSPLTNAEFVQVIRVRQNKVDCDYVPGYQTWPPLTEAELGPIVASHPGALWIIGNEVDRGPNPDQCWLRGQDDTMPEVYAEVYHDAYQLIKKLDPSARLANAALVQVTPGRLQYMDKMWQAYLDKYGSAMPVDVWNIHLYVLPEAFSNGQPSRVAGVALGTDPALAMLESGGDPSKCADPKVYCNAEHDDIAAFSGQIVAMRTWMKEHGQQYKPLMLSEYSILYPYWIDPGPPPRCFQDEYGQCFTSERVRNFMTRSFEYLDTATDPELGYPADENRLVQRWLWFGMYFQTAGYVSNLLTDSQTALTPVGELFQSSVPGYSTYVNLRPDPIPPISLHTASGPVTASISVNVHNVGTTLCNKPFTVTFYSDSARTQPIGSPVTLPGLIGCEAQTATATTSWQNLQPGLHRFWAWVDSGESVNERNEGDNVISGYVMVSQYRAFIPVALRQ